VFWTNLQASHPLLLDGAMGTELIARGLRVREESPEAWNLGRPEDVQAVHSAYVAAGAQALLTNTFGVTRPRLERFGLADRQQEIIHSAVALARAAAGSSVAVIGTLGPTGITLPLKDADLDPVEDAFAEAAARLAEAGVDALLIETMFHAGELGAAVRGARRGAPSLSVCASMTLMAGISGLETPHGVPIARMIAAARESSPDAVGVNCTVDAERAHRAVEALAEAFPSLPIVAKPQAKLSDKCASGRSSESPERFAMFAARLVSAGAYAIGGCCGVGPDGIAALKGALANPLAFQVGTHTPALAPSEVSAS